MTNNNSDKIHQIFEIYVAKADRKIMTPFNYSSNKEKSINVGLYSKNYKKSCELSNSLLPNSLFTSIIISKKILQQ